MRQVIAGLVSMILPLLACPFIAAGSDTNPDRSKPVGNDEYVVYSTIIREHVVREKAPVVWIVNRTEPESLNSLFAFKTTLLSTITTLTLSERVDDIRRRLPSLSRSTVDDYLSKNIEAAPLVRRLHLPVAYRLVNIEDEREHHQSLHRAGNISELVTLSRAGFNRMKNQALVFMTTSGGTDSASTYFLLRRTRSGWNIVESFECF